MIVVAGIGMVSPVGARALDHVFFPRAEAPRPLASPFRLARGGSWDVRRMGALPAFDDPVRRLTSLAKTAAREALSAISAERVASLPLYLCLSAPRESLHEGALALVEQGVVAAVGAGSCARYAGDAGALAALSDLAGSLAEPTPRAALLVAADTFVSLAEANHAMRRQPSPWRARPVPAGEGAAALLLANEPWLREVGTEGKGVVLGAATAIGRGTDGDDEPIDALAMTSLVAALGATGPLRAVYGQTGVDALRTTEWEWTVARRASQFAMDHHGVALECETGRLGAASAAMSLALAFSEGRHATRADESDMPALVWAISPDGTRGVALIEARGHEAFQASDGRPRARAIPRVPYTPVGSRARSEDPHDMALFERLDAIELEFGASFTESGELPPDRVEEVIAAMLAEEEVRERPTQGWLESASPLPRVLEPLPEVAIDAERATLLPIPRFYRDVVAHLAETTAMLARDRYLGSFADAHHVERRMRCQLDATVSVGDVALASLARWWLGQHDDPWAAHAGTWLALGFEGDDVAPMLRDVLDQLDDDPSIAIGVATAAERVDHPSMARLVEVLRGASGATALAAGLALAGLRGELSSGDLERAFQHRFPAVRRAALFVAERTPLASLGASASSALVSGLKGALDAREAWLFARQLAFMGNLEGYDHFPVLGARALDFLILGTQAGTPALFHSIVRGVPIDEDLIDAAGRLGTRTAFDWLVGSLADERWAESAGAALSTVLGDAVPIGARLDAAAWRNAGARRFDGLGEEARLRRGLPHAPSVVLDELAERHFSQRALERRIDEVRAALGCDTVPSLWGFQAEAVARLEAYISSTRLRARI